MPSLSMSTRRATGSKAPVRASSIGTGPLGAPDIGPRLPHLPETGHEDLLPPDEHVVEAVAIGHRGGLVLLGE